MRNHADNPARTDVAEDMAPFRRMVAAVVASGVAMVVLPPDLQGTFFAAFGIVAIVALLVRIRRLPRKVARPVKILVAAGTLSITAGIVRGVHSSIAGVPYPFPSIADAIYLVDYVLFIVAILYIVRLRVQRPSIDATLDAVVGLVAAGLLQWTLVLVPYIRSADVAAVQKLMNLTFSTLTLLMVGAAVLALVAGSVPSASNRLLALGLIATFATDIVAVMASAGRLPPSSETYPAFLIFAFAACGLFHPSVVHLVDRPTDQTLRRRLTRRRVTVLALALLTPPILMLWAAVELNTNTLVLLPAIASLALTPLVVTRLGRLVRQNEEMAALEATLRGVGERLVSAETTDDVVRVITVGAEKVLGAAFISGALVLDPMRVDRRDLPEELAPAVDALEDLGDASQALTTGEVMVSDPGAPSFWSAGMVMVQRELKGLLVLATTRPLSEEDHNAVVALCRESAIAFRAVEQTEQQVRQRSEDRFASLIDNSSDIVSVIDGDLRVTYASPVAERLLGYSAEQINGENAMHAVHPDDAHQANQMIAAIRRGSPEPTELRLRDSAGEFQWYEMVGVDLSDDPNIGGIVLNARAIGDRKEAQAKLVYSEARFKGLVQHSTDLVILVDESSIVRYASPSATDAVHIEAENIVGMHLSDVLRDADIDWTPYLGEGSSSARGRSEFLEFGFHTATDEWRIVETTITDLRDEPAVAGFVLNARDVTDRKTMEKRLRYQATHDELTGLANRVQVLEELGGMLERNSGATTVAALLIDIDDFKDINDSLGHAFGDQLLIAIAQRITEQLSFGDIAARTGGDDFVVVLERGHGENQITNVCDELLDAISSPFIVDGRELSVTASAGVVFDHDRSNTAEILLRNADTAMYKAKQDGKRRMVVFENFMHTASFDRLELRADLARAITGEQFRTHYQPVVDIATQRIVGAEALIRWEHPERGLLGPNLFIPLAEETGLIGALGEWILERACKDLSTWRRELATDICDFTISVNLAVQQLIDPSIVTVVRDITERTGLPADRLVLEVTESQLITETERIASTMHDLRALGARMAVDDFGTGYSSLGYIQQFEFDVLKIDKTFVDDIEGVTGQRIVTAVLELANQLEVRTIAEGIETQVQAEILERLGCKNGQGYLFSRPVPEAQFRELLVSNRSATDGHATL